MNELDKKIFDRFSGSGWILFGKDLLPGFLRHFELIDENKYTVRRSFKETNLDNEDKIIISQEINGWHIVEGSYFDQVNTKNDFEKIVDKSSIYTFFIDLWIPILRFIKYDSNLQTRYYEFYFDPETGNEKEIDIGEHLEYEYSLRLQVPKEEANYGYFWFPIRLMEHLGINETELIKDDSNNYKVYSLSQKLRDKMSSQKAHS